MVGLLLIYVLYEYVFLEYAKKGKGLLIRVFLYEKIGKDIQYIRTLVAEEIDDEKLGNYLIIKKLKVPLERVSNKDYFLDKTYGKALNLVRYAPDDYRPLVRLSEGDWYRVETKQEYEEISKPDPDNSDEVMIVKIPKFDVDGSPVMSEYEVKYEEPIGISKNDRSAMRFNLQYKKRMQEVYGEKVGKWDTIAKFAVPVVAMMVVLMAFVHFSNKDTERAKDWYTEINVQAVEFYKQAEDVSWTENVLKGIQEKNDREEVEKGAPPR